MWVHFYRFLEQTFALFPCEMNGLPTDSHDLDRTSRVTRCGMAFVTPAELLEVAHFQLAGSFV